MKRKVSKYGCPNGPLTPFNFFYKEKAGLYKKGGNKSFYNFMKEVSTEYNNLSSKGKEIYVELSKKDKNRFNEEMEEFKKSTNYGKYLRHLKMKAKTKEADINKLDKKIQRKKSDNKSIDSSEHIKKNHKSSIKENPETEIPIFTKEFLIHNQQREELLRNNKKQLNQLEEQTALLSKHLDNLNNAIEESQKSINKYNQDLSTIEKINSILDQGLMGALCKIKFPSSLKQSNLQITKSNIPLYVNILKDILSNNSETEFISKLMTKMKKFPQLVLFDLKKI